MYARASALNIKNIQGLLEPNPAAALLDVGCDDGTLTLKLAKIIGTSNISGVEIVPDQAEKAARYNIKVKSFDLNDKFDWPDNTFDVVHANQVIEHLYNSDNFLSEIYRTLKPDGYAIISTENASSWCNIFASVMGWQIFSLTNISTKKRNIGNPLAIHRDEQPAPPSWNHVRIYNWRGLKELLEAHSLIVEQAAGAGYFPLPAFLGNIDKIHAHFMTFKARKK